MTGPSLKAQDDRRDPNLAEKAFMLVSAVFTIALFGLLAYHALTSPANGPPHAEVLRSEPTPEGDVVVVVRLSNAGSSGLLQAGVEVACGEAPYPEVTFQNVPAGGSKEARVLCPAGTEEPEARVTFYVEA